MGKGFWTAEYHHQEAQACNLLVSLCFSFFIYKMRRIIVSIS